MTTPAGSCTGRRRCSSSGSACSPSMSCLRWLHCCPSSKTLTLDNHRHEVEMTEEEGVRLQKVLAAAGVGSRRACEALIAEGRVSVDGATVREQGMRVDPETAVVRVDDMRVNTGTSRTYLALNKPRGMVTALSDPTGRPTVGDLLEQRTDRLFHVGRLDADTEGPLL